MLNETFAYWYVGDNGQSTLVGADGATTSSDGSGGQGDLESDPDTAYLPDVLDTFTCDGLVVLKCYEGDGDNFGVNANCSEFDRTQGGCYVFVDNPLIISLFTIDYPLLFEWRLLRILDLIWTCQFA